MLFWGVNYKGTVIFATYKFCSFRTLNNTTLTESDSNISFLITSYIISPDINCDSEPLSVQYSYLTHITTDENQREREA